MPTTIETKVTTDGQYIPTFDGRALGPIFGSQEDTDNYLATLREVYGPAAHMLGYPTIWNAYSLWARTRS